MDYRTEIQLLARAHQYRLHPLALRGVSDHLIALKGDYERQRSDLRDLFLLLHKVCGPDRFVDEEKMKSAIALLSTRAQGTFEEGSPVVLVSLEDVPHVFVDERSGEIKVSVVKHECNRLTALHQRYLFARRRCLRSGLFCRDTARHSLLEGVCPLIPTIALEGIDPTETVAVLGMIVKHDKGIHLEDLHGRVSIIFHEAMRPPMGLVGDGFLVVAKGQWTSGAFVALSIDLPPAERREDMLKDIGSDCDLFGRRPNDVNAALRREKNSLGSVIIVMSQIHLDQRSTVESLIVFLREMQNRSEAELMDTTLVMVGEFCSSSIHYDDVLHLPEPFEGCDRYKSLLNTLATMIAVHAPSVAQYTQVAIVPGQNDVTSLLGLLPQPPIVSAFGKSLQSRLKRVVFASNPCRLRFFTHEIIVARRDFFRSLREKKRSFTWPQEDAAVSAKPFESIAKTIVDEAHLAPDVMERILWKADEALCLTVLPHLLVLCDSTEQWECSYKGVHVVNPGSFSLAKTFLWYTPADGECSLSSVDA
uniref:DNA polymerase epsilon subunit n=1 Tax=Trypanosoma congolense (strain IL3000) TaxID=1068625 RepID=G0UUZ9_TRYCI|nr:putative DNA polymerase epsilon subunit b [Trypanosoma congolense IL3000]